jgi:hypothetical protein
LRSVASWDAVEKSVSFLCLESNAHSSAIQPYTTPTELFRFVFEPHANIDSSPLESGDSLSFNSVGIAAGDITVLEPATWHQNSRLLSPSAGRVVSDSTELELVGPDNPEVLFRKLTK